MIYMKFIVIITLFCQVFSSAIPIWELLTYHEKIGNLTFVFMNLVNIYCKKSTIPDCERVLTLYGVSNLLKEDERTLDLLDPHYWNSRSALWRVAMNGAFKFPRDNDLRYEHPNRHQTEVEEDLNTISKSADVDYNFPNYYDYEGEEGEPHPYAVKVLPPPGFKHGPNSEKSPLNSRTDKPSLIETSTGDSRKHLPRTHVKEDSNYIILLPNGPPPEDGISGRSQNSRFLDFRQKSTLKESRNNRRYPENPEYIPNPNKSILFSGLKK